MVTMMRGHGRRQTKGPQMKRKASRLGARKHVKKARNIETRNEPVKKKRKASVSSEDIPSDSEHSDAVAEQHATSSDEDETEPVRRLKLAKKYLETIEKEEQVKAATDAIDRDIISNRLKKEVLEQAGRLQRTVADKIQVGDSSEFRILKGHKKPITCLVVSHDEKYIYSSSKDSSIIKWCLLTGKKLKIIPGGKKGAEDKHIGHTTTVLCLALSSDNKFLVSGCCSKVIHVWNPDTMEKIHTFKGHRGAVSGLAFQRGTHQLFSASHDRSVKIWNLDELAYVETLFGHQDAVTSIDSLTTERAITSGGRDGSIRIWKVVEESQMVFQGHSGSIDIVRLVNSQHFISGGEDGCLALWTVLKKKPVAMISRAHGVNDTNGEPHWITSLAALTNTDLVASGGSPCSPSGSQDGAINLWKCSEDFRSLSLLHSIPLAGFVNCLQFSSSGKYLVAGAGQEHHLGRWWRVKEARNIIAVITLQELST